MRKDTVVRVCQVLQQQREVDRHIAHKVVAGPPRLVQLRQRCRAQACAGCWQHVGKPESLLQGRLASWGADAVMLCSIARGNVIHKERQRQSRQQQSRLKAGTRAATVGPFE